MNDFESKLLRLAKSLESQYGPIAFFAAAKRSDSLELWDLLVTASWADQKGSKAIDDIVRDMEEIFSPQELTEFSRVVCLTMHSLRSNLLALSIGDLHSDNVKDIRDCTWNNEGVNLDINRVKLNRALVVISHPLQGAGTVLAPGAK